MCGVNYQRGWCRGEHTGGLTPPGPALSLSPVPAPHYLRKPEQPPWLLGNLFRGRFKLPPITCKHPPPLSLNPVRMLSTSPPFPHRVLAFKGTVNHSSSPTPPWLPAPVVRDGRPLPFSVGVAGRGTDGRVRGTAQCRNPAVSFQPLLTWGESLNYSFVFMAFMGSVHILPPERAIAPDKWSLLWVDHSRSVQATSLPRSTPASDQTDATTK